MNDSFSPVLKRLGEWNETSPDTIFWIAIILVSIPLLLLLANHMRHRIQRRRNLAHGFDNLEKIGGEKGLTYPEQVVTEQMARAARLNNPALLLTSIDIFDRAAAIWMKQVQRLPWQEMSTQVERLKSIRHKVGFRYLHSERRPLSTRELILDQRLYALAGTRKGFRLLSAPVTDLNDLAITTGPFTAGKRAVKLKKQHDMWVFFWSEAGGEYRFKTRILKAASRPVPHLMLQHGDDLIYGGDGEIFTCKQEAELVVEWIPVSKLGRMPTSPKVFDRVESETLTAHLKQLTGSGFVLACNDRMEIDDLVRLNAGSNAPDFLADRVGRAVKITREGILFKFLKRTEKERQALLRHITPRLSIEVVSRKMARKPAERAQSGAA